MGYYPMGCSNIFCIEPDEVDTTYFYILAIVSFINCLVALATIYLVLRRIFRACCTAPKADADTSETPVAVVVPCYLPNEQGIIVSTIDHILTRLVHEGPLTLYIVYNTPPGFWWLEEELLRKAQQRHAGGRQLRVVKAAGSQSKAENLNLILQSIHDPFVVLYDADHHADPVSLQLMLQTMLRESACQAVQGSTYIRNTGGCRPSAWLARYLDAEFFVTHFVYFPAMQVLSRVGYFGGSNALWRTDVLKQYPFDPTMHCEDVDLSARVILDGHRILFCPHARSGELSPAGLNSLVKQRLRWFIGWEQVTHKYYWRVFFSHLPRLRKLGFCYMFHMRWVLLFAALLAAVINPIITSPFIYPLPTWSNSIQRCVYVTLSLYGFIAVYGLAIALCPDTRHALHTRHVPPAAQTHHPHHPHSRIGTALWVAIFFCCTGLYVIMHFTLQTVAFFKVFRNKIGEWTVTQRAASPTEPGGLQALKDPLLPATSGAA